MESPAFCPLSRLAKRIPQSGGWHLAVIGLSAGGLALFSFRGEFLRQPA